MRNHIAHVDGLRAVAALAVLGSHLIELVAGYAPFALWAASLDVLHVGWLGVAVFIVISGYCLSLPFAGGATFDTRTFFERRIRRLAPAYLVVLLASVAIKFAVDSLLNHPFDSHFVALRVFAHLALLQTFYVTKSVKDLDQPMWSIATEVQIYVVFAFCLVPLWARFSSEWALRCAVGIAVLLTLFNLPPYGHPWLLIAFAFGMKAAEARASAPSWLRYVALGLVLVSALDLGLHWAHAFDRIVSMRSEMLIAAAAACLLASPPPWIVRLLSWRPLVATGRMSYSIYLVHYPLLLVTAAAIFRFRLGSWSIALYVVTLAVIALCARGLYVVAELPYLRARGPAPAASVGSPRAIGFSESESPAAT